MTVTEVEAAGPLVLEFDIGDRLRKAREHRKLSQLKFGEAISVHRNTIVRYENGEAEPGRNLLIMWALATGVSLKWLETGEAPQPGEPLLGQYVRPEGFEPPTF